MPIKNSSQLPSHHFTRHFQTDKIIAPRDFKREDWSWLVPNGNYVLEIGAGRGKHALEYANSHPTQTVFAIERTRNKFTAFYKAFLQGKKIEQGKSSYSNLYPIHADAIAWVTHAVPKNSLSKIFLLYPNPERNNLNQQWLNMPFFEFLLSRLQPQGQIILASNVPYYLDNAVKQASQIWQLPYELTDVHQDSQRTHFEIKYLARGERCQQIILTKPKGYVTRFDE